MTRAPRWSPKGPQEWRGRTGLGQLVAGGARRSDPENAGLFGRSVFGLISRVSVIRWEGVVWYRGEMNVGRDGMEMLGISRPVFR
jgi:hypothetical protein